MKTILFALLMTSLLSASPALAAIGCTLSNPSQDLKYLFPDMSSYREEVKELSRMPDGQDLYRQLRERLGGDLDPVYESYETPFTVYSVFKGEELIGIVHGVNVPGRGGVIQVFLSTDEKDGTIRRLFYQRLESPAAKKLRSPELLKQFAKLSLRDFYKHDYYKIVGGGGASDPVAAIAPPALDEAGNEDFRASLRGVRKNLILLDFFVYGRQSEPFFQRAQDALKERRGGK